MADLAKPPTPQGISAPTPAEELRAAAKLMRERADAMEAAMRGAPMWEAGYRREIAGALGGPAGEMAAPWDLVTVHAVADWLDRFGDRVYCYGRVEFEYALIIARAYLGSTDA